MEQKNFEEKLLRMSKPEVSQLKHRDMLAKAIIKAKEKSVLSLWWLSIPLYMLAMLLMKSFFMPSTTLFSNLHELAHQMKYTSVLFFVFVPIIFAIINFISIRKIYFFSGSPKTITFLKTIWLNALIILVSLIILFVYL